MPLKRISDVTERPLAAKAASLMDKLAPLESLLVAFSGGVDSSLLRCFPGGRSRMQGALQSS
jgi:hypothetical protein